MYEIHLTISILFAIREAISFTFAITSYENIQLFF